MTAGPNRRGLPLRDPRRFVVRAAVAVVVVAVVAGYLTAADRLGRLRDRFQTLAVTATSDHGPRTWLVVGLDDRDALSPEAAAAEPGARADIVLLITQTPAGMRVTSVPRDLEVPLHVSSRRSLEDRLTLSWLRSPQALLTGLCDRLGVGVDHVVAFDFRSFAQVVDALGGIDVSLAYPLRDADQFDWPAGPLHLDGQAALKFVRSRQAEAFVDGRWQPEPDGPQMRQRRSAQAFSAVLALSKRRPDAALRGLWTAAPDMQLDAGSTWSDYLPLLTIRTSPQLLPTTTVDDLTVTADDDTRRYVADLGYHGCRA